jgi:hypothetical protein
MGMPPSLSPRTASSYAVDEHSSREVVERWWLNSSDQYAPHRGRAHVLGRNRHTARRSALVSLNDSWPWPCSSPSTWASSSCREPAKNSPRSPPLRRRHRGDGRHHGHPGGGRGDATPRSRSVRDLAQDAQDPPGRRRERAVRSITTDADQRLLFDRARSRTSPVKRVAIVDDVISTGASTGAALRLLRGVGAEVVVIGTLVTEASCGERRVGRRRARWCAPSDRSRLSPRRIRRTRRRLGRASWTRQRPRTEAPGAF